MVYIRRVNGVFTAEYADSPPPDPSPSEEWLPLAQKRPNDTASAAAARDGSAAAIRSKAAAALTVNLAWLGRDAAPTNAQVLAHLDRLTRQVNGLLRYAFDRLDDSSGT